MTQTAGGADRRTMWQSIVDEQPRVGAVTDDLIEQLSYIRSTLQGATADDYREYGAPDAPADIMADPGTVALGVFGVGAWLTNKGAVPAVFVHQGLARRAGTPLALSFLRSFLIPRGDDFFLAMAVPVEQPTRYMAASPGAPVPIGSRAASIAATGTCPRTGDTGFLTAAHAAPDVGAIVRHADGDRLGTVARIFPTDWSDLRVTADVAFVASTAVVTPRPTCVRSLRAGDPMRLQSARGTMTSFVRGLSPGFFVSPTEPPWGQVALTASAISRHGDSGAPVYGADDCPVGMLVGGTTNDLSVIQDLSYQLDSIEVDVV